jgi:hypothetical protein
MILFYNAETRAGATPPIDAGGVLKERHEIAVGAFGDWTHLVAQTRLLLWLVGIVTHLVAHPRLGERMVTTCLQSSARLSSTVYGPAQSGFPGPLEHSNVQVWLSVSWRPADGHLERGRSAPGFLLSTWGGSVRR